MRKPPWITTLLLLAAGAMAVGSAAQPIPGTDLEATALVAELPWTFEVTVESAEDQKCYRFKSTEPYSAGPTYLRLELETSEFAAPDAAEGAFEELLASADPATGLSYAWDQVFLSGATIYHLKVPCLFSEASFRRIASALEAAVQRRGQPLSRTLKCRCGTGCREAGRAGGARDTRDGGGPTLMAWPDGEYEHYLHDVQAMARTRAQVATGKNGAVTVALNGFAARAGLEALKQGGSAADAALTAAMTQVTLTAGGPVSYFGILSMVYYEAESGRVVALNAEWNTVRGETDPASIPGRVTLATKKGHLGTRPSGRTALVGGFMKGVEAAHQRFGRLPFATLFEPAIHLAENGFPVRPGFARVLEKRAADLARLPETRAVFTKKDGSFYAEGDVLRQPALAETLRAIAAHGADHLYGGPWGRKLVAAVQADGGKMTLRDLEDYEVLWQEPLKARVGDYEVHTSPPPNAGGASLIEALHLAMAAELPQRGHWSTSGDVLRDAVDIGMAGYLRFRSPAALAGAFPGIDFSPASRIRREHADELWRRVRNGAALTRWEKPPRGPRHSDDVVAIDSRGNIAAITHTNNSVAWGKTAIFVDGISIGDPGAYQQARIARVDPGQRLPAQTETGILSRDGVPVLAFASMGTGLHQRTFQALMNVIGYGMTVDEAVDAPDFFLPQFAPTGTRVAVPKGRFPADVLEAMGYAYVEVDPATPGLGGDGIWVAIHRDPDSGTLRAASNNRKNGAAVAY